MDQRGTNIQQRCSALLDTDRVNAVTPSQPKPIVLVLGMRGSGIMLCSQLLSILGIEMSHRVMDVVAARMSDGDPLESRKQSEIAGFHDRILALFNRNGTALTRDFPLPIAWWSDFRVVQIRRE